MRPILLLDIDGVCANFAQSVVDAVNRHTCEGWTYDDVTQWDIYKALAVVPAVVKLVDDEIKARGFCRAIQQYPHAREGIDRIRQFADVCPVTAPFDGDHWIGERKAWLVEELGFSKLDIIFTDAKHRVDGDVLVDDKPSTLRKWKEERTRRGNPNTVPVLFSGPWNRAESDEGLIRINDWHHLVAFLRLEFT